MDDNRYRHVARGVTHFLMKLVLTEGIIASKPTYESYWAYLRYDLKNRLVFKLRATAKNKWFALGRVSKVIKRLPIRMEAAARSRGGYSRYYKQYSCLKYDLAIKIVTREMQILQILT